MTGHPEARDLVDLVERVPEGWTLVAYEGRRYGLARTTRGHGRVVSLRAEPLGGGDAVSANVYRTEAGAVLRPCEMPAETVLAFLRGWHAAPPPSTNPAPSGRSPAPSHRRFPTVGPR